MSLTSSLRVISLTALAHSIKTIFWYFLLKKCGWFLQCKSFCTAKATLIFSAKKFQHICVSLDINFNKSLTNNNVSFEQLGPCHYYKYWNTLTLYSVCPKIWNSLFYYLLMCLRWYWMSGKQCRPWADIVFWYVWSGSALFAQACLSQYLGLLT